MCKIVVCFILLIGGFYKTAHNQVRINAPIPVDTNIFPYSFINDDKSPRYTYYRAEGDNTKHIFSHYFKYLRKYNNKKNTTNSSEIMYFQNQTLIFDWLLKHKVYDKSNDLLKIGLVGDLMWIRNNWNSFVDKKVLEEMQQYDFWIGNLETPVDKNKKVKSFWPDYIKYNSDSCLLTSFINKDKSSLFKIVSLANNHVLDKGEEGINATLAFLKNNNILNSGVSENKSNKPYITIIENNIKIGFYAACWGVNDPDKLKKTNIKLNIIKGIAPIGTGKPDLTEVKNVLKEMENEGVDFKIISLHWGAEYEMYPDPIQIVIAREIVQSGADIILGHHSHVTQPSEVLFLNGYEKKFKNDSSFNKFVPVVLTNNINKPRKALVLYSLGNFTSEMFTELCQTGVMIGLNVFRNKEGLVDWEVDKITKVINIRNGAPKRKHRLVLK